MEEAFHKLKENQQNTVENIVKWMKESKLVESSKAAEEKAHKLFSDVKDKANVELEDFKKAIAKLAAEHKKPVEEMCKKLAEAGPKILEYVANKFTNAFSAGASAVKDAMKKK